MTSRPSGEGRVLRRPSTSAALAAAALAAWLAWRATPAQAHGVYMFAWPQGDQICSDSYFSKKSRVRGGRVSLRDASGQVLQTGTTDEQGSFCFRRPPVEGDLLLAVEAGEGHRAEFRLRAEDLGPAPTAGPAVGASGSSTVAPAAAASAVLGGTADAGADALRAIVREELAAQLGPITRRLAADADDQTPGAREIVGGLGWLAGLFGLLFWRSARARAKKR
jgi:nickel transport protein